MAEYTHVGPGLPPLHGAPLVFLTLATALSTFMEVLDTTIANVAVQTISGSMGVSAREGTSIISSYSLAAAIAVPLTGWLAAVFGLRRLLLTCTVIFLVFSVLCGTATSLGEIILFRVGQGFTGGVLIPLAFTILLIKLPLSKRGCPSPHNA